MAPSTKDQILALVGAFVFLLVVLSILLGMVRALPGGKGVINVLKGIGRLFGSCIEGLGRALKRLLS